MIAFLDYVSSTALFDCQSRCIFWQIQYLRDVIINFVICAPTTAAVSCSLGKVVLSGLPPLRLEMTDLSWHSNGFLEQCLEC